MVQLHIPCREFIINGAAARDIRFRIWNKHMLMWHTLNLGLFDIKVLILDEDYNEKN